jgi:hypothetical protein
VGVWIGRRWCVVDAVREWFFYETGLFDRFPNLLRFAGFFFSLFWCPNLFRFAGFQCIRLTSSASVLTVWNRSAS